MERVKSKKKIQIQSCMSSFFCYFKAVHKYVLKSREDSDKPSLREQFTFGHIPSGVAIADKLSPISTMRIF